MENALNEQHSAPNPVITVLASNAAICCSHMRSWNCWSKLYTCCTNGKRKWKGSTMPSGNSKQTHQLVTSSIWSRIFIYLKTC